MTSAILITSLVALAGLLLTWQIKRHTSAVTTNNDLHPRLSIIDIDAFRNLTDPAEDKFLEARLPHREYRKLQRQRLRATLAYISCLQKNTAVLIKMGETARRTADHSIVEAGTKLVNSALSLRLQILRVKVKIYVQIAYPGMQTRSRELVDRYEQMTRHSLLLGRLQDPARGISGAF